MLKPVAAGLMCLGFVTLGVAISQGQDEDTIVIEGKVGATEVPVGEALENPQVGQRTPLGYAAAAVEAAAGGEARLSVNGQEFRIVKSENGEVVVLSEDGKIVERHDAGAGPGRVSARFTRLAQAPQVVDPQTRESLEKMIVALKEQIQKLESEGKKDEAQQKTHSLRSIEALLHANRHVINFARSAQAPNQALAEIQNLHARLNAMVEESSKLPEGAAAERDKIMQEIEKVKKQIAEKHQALTATNQVFGQAYQFNGFGRFPQGMGQPGAPQWHTGIDFKPGHPGQFGQSEGGILAQRAAALSQAAARLKEAGLPEQARPLQEQAEQFKVKAEKMMLEEAERNRAQAQVQGAGGFGGGGFAGGGFGGGAGARGFGGFFGGGPANDLNNSIRELHEQVQQLRKEVGELRELLQRKQ